MYLSFPSLGREIFLVSCQGIISLIVKKYFETAKNKLLCKHWAQSFCVVFFLNAGAEQLFFNDTGHACAVTFVFQEA